MANNIVIDRYSRTLFQYAQSTGTLELIYQEVQSLTVALKSDIKISEFVKNPTIAALKKFELIKGGINDKASKTLLSFIKVLANRNRIGILNEILLSFVQLYKMDVLKTKEAVVKSVSQLDQQQIQELKKKIDGIDGFQYEIKNEIDPTLIGGVSVIIGNNVIDCSVSGKIQLLKKKLLA